MSIAQKIISVPAEGSGFKSPLGFALPQPKSRIIPKKLVKLCYTLVHACETLKIRDLADGEFRPADTTLEQGINRQLNYLLDEVACNRPGFRLLEIGSGYGNLLKAAKERGALAVGVNISSEQVKFCNDNGLQTYQCNYRDLLNAKEWYGKFDGVIANGSLEHWVQPEDVLSGKMNDIYNESFQIAHKMIDPNVANARYVTTAIHVNREVKPEFLLTPWYKQPKDSDRRHFSLLHNWMGGYYPVSGQLEECAQPYFSLEKEMDGTLGYKIANDYRMARMMRGWYTNPRMVWRIFSSFLRHYQESRVMFQCYFVEKSWDWQFLGEDPPMKLLRHTWKLNSSSNG
ncbi:MAG: class I SAM-dependent methyltransferase [Desulfobacula sp.]|nr:class I SAM-dependent methyltransferase [Desulfobacula sp.]